MRIAFFTSFQSGWLNAWILTLCLLLIQFVYMLIYREGGKRAVDTSWYTLKDKCNASFSTFFQVAVIIISFFTPLKLGTAWFFIGCILFGIAMVGFMASFYAYAATPKSETVTHGIYRLSRNPMYFFFDVGMLAACVASASLWLLLVTFPFIIVTHWVILGEERYCEKTYGNPYLTYKAKTPRYFLLG